MIGKTISHYRVLEKLGEGGMGVVYKAEDLKLHRFVALKFLHSDLTRDDEAKARFIHEAEAASALDYPTICTIHEIDDTQEIYYPAVMKAIVATGYKGFVGQEFVPKGPDALASLRRCVQICDV